MGGSCRCLRFEEVTQSWRSWLRRLPVAAWLLRSRAAPVTPVPMEAHVHHCLTEVCVAIFGLFGLSLRDWLICCALLCVVGYFCKCTAAFMGTHCEVTISPCASNPCLYGGTCIPRGGDFYCQCRGQYSGQRWEHMRMWLQKWFGHLSNLHGVQILCLNLEK